MGHKSHHHHHSKEKDRSRSRHRRHNSHSKRSLSQSSTSSSSSVSSGYSSADSYSRHSHKKRKHHHKDKKKNKKENSKHSKIEVNKTNEDTKNVLVGPPLLPDIYKNSDIPKEDNINNNEKGFVGPMLPSFMKNDNDENTETNNDNNSHIIGPTLNKPEQKSKIIGPSMPPSFNDDKIVGPSLPQNKSNNEIEKKEEESDDDDIIGPLPMAPGYELTEEEETQRIVKEFEERAERMKRKLEGKDEPEKPKKLVRDEWMTTLPDDNILDRINVLKPRQFRKNGVAKIDRSGWTDTPADKLRKQKEGIKDKNEKVEYIQINKNDIEMQKMIDQYNKEHRNESLYDQHAKEYFKNKKYEENDISKLPFDRERDVLGSGSKGSIGKTNALKGVLGAESANRFTHSTTKRFL